MSKETQESIAATDLSLMDWDEAIATVACSMSDCRKAWFLKRASCWINSYDRQMEALISIRSTT